MCCCRSGLLDRRCGACTGDRRDFGFAVRCAGRDRGAFGSAARAAPFGTLDVCVFFWVKAPEGDSEHPARACDGAMFATREPVPLGRTDVFVPSAIASCSAIARTIPGGPWG